MIKLAIFLLMIMISVVFMILLLVNGIRLAIKLIRHQDKTHVINMIKKQGIFLLSIFLITMIYVAATQIMTYTPKIKDSDGNEVYGSIAELRKVNLNGRNEWISIRGQNKDAPILLFLAGGPGGTQMAAVRYELSELEKNFVVVVWDQPGSGKSYNCMNRNDIKVQTYIDDGISLTKYLKDEFGDEKIYLVGESWGSALGAFLIHEKPEYYAGFIGTGQMVNFKETEKLDYKKAIEIAQDKGDKETVKKLINQGEPPYYEGNIALKSNTYFNVLTSYMTSDIEIVNGGYHTFRDMLSSEYGVLDSVNYLLGMVNTFNVVYPQLYDTDLRTDYNKLKVPVYFFIGRHDINAPTELTEEYYNSLDAPEKKLIWFEHSGHDPWLNESELFVQDINEVFGK